MKFRESDQYHYCTQMPGVLPVQERESKEHNSREGNGQSHTLCSERSAGEYACIHFMYMYIKFYNIILYSVVLLTRKQSMAVTIFRTLSCSLMMS